MKADLLYQPKVLNIIKVVLLVVTFGFIFYKLFYAYHIGSLVSELAGQITFRQLVFLPAVLLLTCANWLLESVKWRLLISKGEPMSLGAALKAVLSGIAVSLITPNQLGDFAGRVIHLKTFGSIRGSLVTVIGHTAQVIMTAAFGLYALTWFLRDQNLITGAIAPFAYAIVTVCVVAAVWAFLHFDRLGSVARNTRAGRYLDVFAMYDRDELATVLLLALARYAIFLAQFLLLVRCYEVETTFFQSLFCIVATLCAQSFAPSFLLVEIGLRGASALLFFGYYSQNSAGILLSAYSLWIINLMLPGLAGLYFILKWRKVK